MGFFRAWKLPARTTIVLSGCLPAKVTIRSAITVSQRTCEGRAAREDGDEVIQLPVLNFHLGLP